MMAAGYDMRGPEGRNRKQSMAELKLRRLQELNARLKEDLERRRIPVSEAAAEYATLHHRQLGGIHD
jgi:guanine nucleotide-binding protein subunit gamma, fungi